MSVTAPGFDPLLLDPTRLSITALLAATRWAEFKFVRDSLNLSDSALSKQISTLSKREYVEVKKGHVGKVPRTWLNLSRAGHLALQAHLTALQDIADRSARHVADDEHAGSGPPGSSG
ncbi:winged helix-turn-helix domain-containing protein [Streptomyces sioyaensis]|uniref:winged helix-turn-helix domain-containing protein n=1 Tax=Streptomyces sioyaensis TaxID=67364 RepID=UPI0036A5D1D6